MTKHGSPLPSNSRIQCRKMATNTTRVDHPQIPTRTGALAAILNECLSIHNRQSDPVHMHVNTRVVAMRATKAACMVYSSRCVPCAVCKLTLDTALILLITSCRGVINDGLRIKNMRIWKQKNN